MDDKQKWLAAYEQVLLEDGKQSAIQVKKKAQSKSETADKGLDDERMRELSRHDAQREIRKSTAKKLFKKDPADLNEVQKGRLNKEMDKTIVQKRVDKLANIKFQEKKLKQQAKDLRQQAALATDEMKKNSLLAKANELDELAKMKKDSYKNKKAKDSKEVQADDKKKKPLIIKKDQ